MKICSKCQQGKPSGQFHVDRQKSDGLASSCKACISTEKKIYYSSLNPERIAFLAAKERRQRAINPQPNRVAVAKWRAKNPAIRKAAFAAFRAANPNYWKLHRRNNRARYKANALARRIANPFYARKCAAAYRSRKRNAAGSYTVADVHAMMRRQRGKCAICRSNIRRRFHVDHVISLEHGGANGPANLQLLCPPCNQSKGARDPIVFMQSRGFLL